MTLPLLATLVACFPCMAHGSAEKLSGITDQWSERLRIDLGFALQAEEEDSIAIQSSLLLAAYSLSLVGHDDVAMDLVGEISNDDLADSTLSSAADGQVTAGNLEGALRTAGLLHNIGHTQATKELIAIRLAQRGDFAESKRVLSGLKVPSHQETARRHLICELLEERRYSEVIEQYSLVVDTEARERIRKEMSQVRTKLEPGDPNYIDATVDREKRLRRRLTGFSDEDELKLRLECKARVAIHNRDLESFRYAISDALDLAAGMETEDRCRCLLSFGVLCAEFGDRDRASFLFQESFDGLLETSKPNSQESFAYPYQVILGKDLFDYVAKVMDEDKMRRLSKRLIDAASRSFVARSIGCGLAINDRIHLAEIAYQDAPDLIDKVHLSSGVLTGISKRMRQKNPDRNREPTNHQEQKENLTIIDRIIADKPIPSFVNTNDKRPDREFLGAYNVPRASLNGLDAELWNEEAELGDVSLEEFMEVRSKIVTALWGHGSVYGVFAANTETDFFVYEDKFFDRTQKIELTPSEHLHEILPPAVAELQKVLAEHPRWRVMVLGDGPNAKDEFFVIYPDAIRVLQSSEADTMRDAIELNAKLRAN
ncbi:MAG: hypothetical protein AAGD07_18960 [Planctomycetota bacterium]